MTISVLVPAYNEAGGLARSLGAIQDATQAFQARGWRTELVVCDNNSTDDTARIAREAGAIVVFEPVNQIGRARNAAAFAATGDWFVFVDADSEPSAALFDDVARQIISGRVLAGGSTATMDDDRWWVRGLLTAWNWHSRIGRWAAGAFIFVEADAFREEAGFSRVLYAGEELELFRRLKRRASRTGRSIRILHRHPLRTSARKLHLYSGLEVATFLTRTVLSGGRALTNADDCFVWYDGRR